MVILNKPKYWFQTKAWRIALMVAGTIVVLALVVFNQQIGQLLSLFGSKAEIQANTIQLNRSNFLDSGYTQTPDDSFRIDDNGTPADTSDDRLMLNSTGQ